MGLNTHPCGAPILSVRLGEKWGPNLTVWRWLARKSLIQWQLDGKSPKSVSLVNNLPGLQC